MSQNSSQTTIEALEKDILLEIFEFLDAETLKICTTICSKWNTIIGASSSTMRKLPLKIGKRWEESLDAKCLRRKFSSIIIDSAFISGSLVDVLSKLGRNALDLEIVNIKATDGSLTKILNSMQKLENITIRNSSIDTNQFEEDTTPCSLTSIKSLTLVKSFWDFLEFVKNTQVKALKIVATTYTKVDAICFKDFMAKQNNLESLAVSVQQNEFITDLEKVTEMNRRFQIENLAVDYKNWNDDDRVDEAFTSFLKNNSATLESLEIGHEIADDILEGILALRIKKLMIDGSGLTSQAGFYRNMKANQYLQTLVISRLDIADVAIGLLRVYSTVEKLAIHDCSEEITTDVLIFIAKHCKKLKHLEIPKLPRKLKKLSMPSLKTFTVSEAGEADEWQAFCDSSPSIEHLTILLTPTCLKQAYEVLKIISQSLKLENLIVGFSVEPDHSIIELMSQNSQNFDLLVLNDIPGEQYHIQKAADYQVYCYHRHGVQFPKRESSVWLDGEIDTSDESNARKRVIRYGSSTDSLSTDTEMGSSDDDFIDDS